MLYTFLRKKKNIIILGIFIVLLYIHLITKSHYIIIVYIILVIVCDNNCCRSIIVCLGICMSIYRVFVPFREAINSLENNIKSISNCFSIPKVFDDLQKSIIPTKTKARTIPLTTGKRPVEDHGDEESACSAVISFPSIKCPEGSYDSGEESMNDETDGNTSSIIKDNMKSERGNDLNAQSKPMKQKFQHQKSATEQYLSMILSHAEHKCIVGKDSIGVKNHSKYEISTIKQGH